MKRLALLIIFVGMGAYMAQASSVDLTLHTTGDTPTFGLSTLDVWGTPGDSNGTSDQAFYTSGPDDTGTDFIQGLNLINDTGLDITTLTIYAYGTIGSSVYDPSCTAGSGFNTTFTCAAPADQAANTTISESNPIAWTFTADPGDYIAPDDEFRLVDTATGTGTDLYYEIEINGNPPTGLTATPEPGAIPFLAGGVILMGLALRRKVIRAS